MIHSDPKSEEFYLQNLTIRKPIHPTPKLSMINFNVVPRQIRKPSVKNQSLNVAKRCVETYSRSNAVAPDPEPKGYKTNTRTGTPNKTKYTYTIYFFRPLHISLYTYLYR